MTLVLHIETATDICSVSLGVNGDLLEERRTQEARQHISHLSLLIDDLLASQNQTYRDLHAIALSTGPGSYTGLRVGYATGKGLAMALDIPLIEVDTLYSIAWGMKKTSPANIDLFVPMIDARRMEVYTAHFDQELNLVKPAEPWIIDTSSINDIINKHNHIAFGGNGAFKIEQIEIEMTFRKGLFISDTGCDSSFLVANAYRKWQDQNFADVAYCEPRYIKPPNITKPKAKF